MSQQTYAEVQATLLNSESAPREEIHSALAAVCHFADTEVEMAFGEWLQACERAWGSR